MGSGRLCYAGQVPTFLPFAGLRYDLDLLAALEPDGSATDRTTVLSQVLAPPYDVISPTERDELAASSHHNVVQLELPIADPVTGLDAYQMAAHLLEEWRSHGILRRDTGPAFYGYAMSFENEMGQPRRTVGVIGALALSPPGVGDILPHEHTMPKPKSDRLDLLRACHANLSPVWGLSLAPGLSELCQPPAAEETVTAVEHDAVTHQLWPMDDPQAARAISKLVGSAPVVIADGHHRYETALAYQAERRTGSNGQPGDHDYIMALVVELADDQLSVRPIHRLVSGLSENLDLVAELSRHFEMISAPDCIPGWPPGGVEETAGSALLFAMADHGALGLVTPGGLWLARPRPSTLAAAGADLDSSRLDLALADLPPHELEYQHELPEALNSVRSGRAQAAVLLRPANVAVIAETARQRRRMPPKTTLFWPKPRTGMVIRPVAP